VIVELRQQRRQDAPRVANEGRLDRIAQAEALGIEVDLNGARLAGLGIEFDVGEAAADDEQRIAAFERLLRRPRAEQADAPGGIGAVVRQGALAEQRFRDRRAQAFRDGGELVAGPDGAAPGKDADLLAVT
jgi:hypothetical protein